MQVDRKKFLLALGLSSAAACATPSNGGASNTAGSHAGQPTVDPSWDDHVPGDAHCVGFSEPANECVEWSDGSALPGFAPTSECWSWDTGEAGAAAPTEEQCHTWLYEPSSEA